jgi:hypothetical protein
MKVVIAGGRDFNDYEFLKSKLGFLLQNTDKRTIEIVSGGARGADALGERYAHERGLRLIIFHADWNKHGRAAGVIRNKEMAIYSTHVVCFWDGASRGTKNMIEEAKAIARNTRVYIY